MNRVDKPPHSHRRFSEGSTGLRGPIWPALYPRSASGVLSWVGCREVGWREPSPSTSPRKATVVLVSVPQGCAGQFCPHYIRVVPAEFYHGLNLVKWDGGTTDYFGLECAETITALAIPCKTHVKPMPYPHCTHGKPIPSI